MATFTLTAGNDTFDGADAAADTVRGAATHLGAGDLLDGGGGDAIDTLTLLGDAVVLDAAALAGVQRIERIALLGGNNTLTATDALVTTADLTIFRISGRDGADHIDAGAVTARQLYITGDDGDDRLYGGSGNDTLAVGGGTDLASGGGGDDWITFDSATELTAADTVQGGTGIDTLVLGGEGTMAADALAGVSGIERIVLSAATSIAIPDMAVDGADTGALRVSGRGGNDTVDASAVTAANGFELFGGGGDDSLIAGAGPQRLQGDAGDDRIVLTSDELSGMALFGGIGSDTLEIGSGGTVDLRDAAVLNGFEAIAITAEASVQLRGAMSVDLGTAGGTQVLGSSGADTLHVRAAGQMVDGRTGDDRILLDAVGAAGSTLMGGSGWDTLFISGSDAVDLNDLQVGGFEEINFNIDPSGTPGTVGGNLILDDQDRIVRAGDGGDRIDLGTGYSTVHAGGGNDTITSTFGFQVIDAGAGDDVVRLEDWLWPATRISGGEGNDTLEVVDLEGIGAPMMLDQFVGGFEEIQLISGVVDLGVWAVTAVIGPVHVTGTAYDDFVILYRPNHSVSAGAGDDIVTISSSRVGSTVDGGEGVDTLVLAGLSTFDLRTGVTGFEYVVVADVPTKVLLSDEGTFLDLGTAQYAYARGGGGNDTVLLNADYQFAQSAGGDDVIIVDMEYVDFSTVTVKGGPGQDELVFFLNVGVDFLTFVTVPGSFELTSFELYGGDHSIFMDSFVGPVSIYESIDPLCGCEGDGYDPDSDEALRIASVNLIGVSADVDASGIRGDLLAYLYDFDVTIHTAVRSNDIDAGSLSDDRTVTLLGDDDATVSVAAADVDASGSSGDITVNRANNYSTQSLTGGSGDDLFILTGGSFNGTIAGGDGIDTISFTSFATNFNPGSLTGIEVIAVADNFTLNLSRSLITSQSWALSGSATSIVMVSLGMNLGLSLGELDLSDWTGTIRVLGSGAATIEGSAGTDEFYGSGASTITGNGGDDLFVLQQRITAGDVTSQDVVQFTDDSGGFTITYDAVDEVFVFTGTDATYRVAGSGLLEFADGDVYMVDPDGSLDHALASATAADRIVVLVDDTGDDLLDLDTSAALFVEASGRADDIHIMAGTGSDTLIGGAGDDTLSGDDGDDSIVGGGGSDLIATGAGSDTVDGLAGDVTVGIQIADLSTVTYADGIAAFAASGDLLGLDAGDLIDFGDLGSEATIESTSGADTIDFASSPVQMFEGLIGGSFIDNAGMFDGDAVALAVDIILDQPVAAAGQAGYVLFAGDGVSPDILILRIDTGADSVIDAEDIRLVGVLQDYDDSLAGLFV